MYIRWAQRHDLLADLIDGLRHEESGIRLATLHIRGPFAYGQLWGEAGVHRLVRTNPLWPRQRQQSLVAVDVLPDLVGAENIPLPLNELQSNVFLTGGPGGQHL